MPESGRRAKGAGIVELVKVLRAYRRAHPIEGLGKSAEHLLDERIMTNEWYSLDAFLELLAYAYRHLLGSSEEAALQMGAAGGRALLQGPHKAFVKAGDPTGSVVALRHSWLTYYDFGNLAAELVDDRTVEFVVTGYPDVPVPHGMMIAGWAVAAAELAGARDVRCDILERPWIGDERQVHRVSWASA
jgi:hypothetical protein